MLEPTLFHEGFFTNDPAYRFLSKEYLAGDEIAAKHLVFNTPRTVYDRLETNARKVTFLRNFESEFDDGDINLHQMRLERFVITPPTTLYYGRPED